jgi:hypothetical protein
VNKKGKGNERKSSGDCERKRDRKLREKGKGRERKISGEYEIKAGSKG